MLFFIHSIKTRETPIQNTICPYDRRLENKNHEGSQIRQIESSKFYRQIRWILALPQ